MLTSIVGVVVLLGGLIFFHESGHYLVAKLFGVKVEVFSLGFGKKLFSKRVGDTEYCLSAFPLGGYVKLMGDDPYKEVPPEEAHRAFSTQKLYKRFAIVAAGPIANLLLAYVLYTIVFWFGLPIAATTIGNVIVDSPAWEAGIRPSDTMVSIEGTKINNWPEYEKLVKPLSGRKITVVMNRNGENRDVSIKITDVQGRNAYGQTVTEGGIEGIRLLPIASMVGISDPKSIAYQAGIRTGDVVTQIADSEVKTFLELRLALESHWETGKEIPIQYKRMGDAESLEGIEAQTVTLRLPSKTEVSSRSPAGVSELLGLHMSDTFVNIVTPDSPAEKGGMLSGDRVVSLDGKHVYNFEAIVASIQEIGETGASVNMVLERGGENVLLNLTPIKTTREDPLTHQEVDQFIVGFQHYGFREEPAITKLQIRDFGKLIPHAISETNRTAKQMLISIGMLIVGDVSVKNLGGPVLIARLAGQSLETGLIPFLKMMALISINLFLLNLFPIPVLDGGHLLFFTIEAVQRKPVSIRTMELANQVGMVIILMLVGLTLFNDIGRMVGN